MDEHPVSDVASVRDENYKAKGLMDEQTSQRAPQVSICHNLKTYPLVKGLIVYSQDPTMVMIMSITSTGWQS